MPVPALIPALIGSAINSATAPSGPPALPAAMSQTRSLPENTKLGQMGASAVGAVQIDGQMMKLSPGAQIRNEMNMIVMPGTLQQPMPVRYLVDGTGMVWRIWILTPAEVAASR